MRILLLNQAFYPDVVSTAQHLTDLAVALVDRGHQVTVISGRRAYDDPDHTFAAQEMWRGINIRRVSTTKFGKSAKWRRAVDFASFIGSCCWQLLWVRQPDAVVALTSPPLISFIGAIYARFSGARFFYWVMDLNPDEAIAAGWLREGSALARLLGWMSCVSLRGANKVIALDRFMRSRIEAKGIAPERIAVLAPWSHDDAVHFDPVARQSFREGHGLSDKFVVMYSGNHSPCHPLDTLLAAAKIVATEPRYTFLFVGGGSEFAKVKRFAAGNRLNNIVCLPYQPLEQLAGSLSAADLQVVVMGNPFVGTIHPCKIYNILSVGAPLLYIGPESSHVADVLTSLKSDVAVHVAHGDAEGCVTAIRRIDSMDRRGEMDRFHAVARDFSKQNILPRFIAELEHR